MSSFDANCAFSMGRRLEPTRGKMTSPSLSDTCEAFPTSVACEFEQSDRSLAKWYFAEWIDFISVRAAMSSVDRL